MEKLEKNDFLFQSFKMSENLHKKGLNVRSISNLYEISTNPYIKKLFLNEMVVRVCKILVRFELSQELVGCSKNARGNNIYEILNDFFNIFVDKSKARHEKFWEEIIWPLLESKFNLSILKDIKDKFSLEIYCLNLIFENLGVEGKKLLLSVKREESHIKSDDFELLLINPKAKFIKLSAFDIYNLMDLEINQENENFQERFYEIINLKYDFLNKKFLQILEKEGYKKSLELNPFSKSECNFEKYAFSMIKNLRIKFILCINNKNPVLALEILDQITNYMTLFFPTNNPFYIELLMKLNEFYKNENFENEAIFLSKILIEKYEKTIGFEFCYKQKIYKFFYQFFKKYPSETSLSYCLNQICLFEKVHLVYFKELIDIYMQQNDQTNALFIFEKFLQKIAVQNQNYCHLNEELFLMIIEIFNKIKEGNIKNEFFRIVWIFLKQQKYLTGMDMKKVLSKFLSLNMKLIMLQFEEDSKKFLIPLLNNLEKKTKNQSLIIKFLEYFKEMSNLQLQEFLKETITIILLKKTIDEDDEKHKIFEIILSLIEKEEISKIFI